MTPKGTKLPGIRSDGLWSCTFRYEGAAEITCKINQVLEHLISHKRLFHKLDEMGAQTSLYLQLPGDTNIGDRIPWDVLEKFAKLRIALELETFPDWK